MSGIISSLLKIVLYPWQALALYRKAIHFALFGGVATGKTFIGSHFVIDCIEMWPGKSGLVGANTYDQLSQATLRELFFWLDHYKYEYWVDQKPPGEKKKFKTYKNIISVTSKSGPRCYIFTRVMSKADALRGIQFTWYWMDEIKDTPENTHDVILARCREQKEHIRGLVTGTPNGNDWSYKRFVLAQDKKLYGYTHVKTSDSVKAGIISEEFYQGMLKSYSPLMAAQELDAQHVNFGKGRAYYTASEENVCRVSPWGTTDPDWASPLIVGCDFNYSPAPAIWVVGQLGPAGSEWEDCVHWFFEIAEAERSTPQMTWLLMQQTKEAFLRVYGDASGTHGATSNAGDTDYNQISFELSEGRRGYTIDVERSNPIVRERVENVCRIMKDASGRVRMTWNPDRCPNLDADMKIVGWIVSTSARKARLDNKGDYMRTHASDAVGYAIWKVFPPNLRQLQISRVEKQW